jgi:Holliday junction resolvase RusA-like endonuclease
MNSHSKYSEKWQFDELPPMNTAHTRRHWSSSHRESKKWEQLVWAVTSGARPDHPLEFAFVHCTRHSSTCPDYDNLVMSFKPVIDALKKNDMIVDDDMKRLQREYDWEYAPRKKGYITIKLGELSEPKR